MARRLKGQDELENIATLMLGGICDLVHSAEADKTLEERKASIAQIEAHNMTSLYKLLGMRRNGRNALRRWLLAQSEKGRLGFRF